MFHVEHGHAAPAVYLDRDERPRESARHSGQGEQCA